MPDKQTDSQAASEPQVRSSAWLGRINVTRDTDCNLYLLPTVGLSWQKLLDFERDYEREVMNATTTHKLWIRLLWWKYQRTVCVHLSLRPN